MSYVEDEEEDGVRAAVSGALHSLPLLIQDNGNVL